MTCTHENLAVDATVRRLVEETAGGFLSFALVVGSIRCPVCGTTFTAAGMSGFEIPLTEGYTPERGLTKPGLTVEAGDFDLL